MPATARATTTGALFTQRAKPEQRDGWYGGWGPAWGPTWGPAWGWGPYSYGAWGGWGAWDPYWW